MVTRLPEWVNQLYFTKGGSSRVFWGSLCFVMQDAGLNVLHILSNQVQGFSDHCCVISLLFFVL